MPWPAMGIPRLAMSTRNRRSLRCLWIGSLTSCRHRMWSSAMSKGQKWRATIRPVIICEVGGETSERMTDILVKERYRLYDGEKPLSRDAEVTRATWNTIGIPEELQQRYIVDPPNPK